MRQVSNKSHYMFFLQAYFLIFSTEILFALINPSYVQIFFDEASPFYQQLSLNHYNALAYGVFIMGGQVAGLIANVVLGYLSDRIGRKPVILISIVAVLVTGVSAVLSDQLLRVSIFIVGYILGQLLYGMFPVIIASVSTAAYGSKRKLVWIGLLQFFTGLAFVLGPALGGIMMTKYHNFFAPYYVIIIIGALLLLISWRFIHSQKQPSADSAVSLVSHIRQMFQLLRDKRIIILTVLLLLDQVAWGTYFQFIQPFVKLNFNFSATEIGYLVSFIGLSLMVSALVLLPILQRFFSHQLLFILAICSMIFGMLGVVYLTEISTLNDHFIIYSMSFAVAFGDMVVFSLLVVGFTSAVPKENQGFISGVLYTLAKGFGWGASALLGGYLMLINVTWVMLFSAFVLIICLVFFYAYRKQSL